MIMSSITFVDVEFEGVLTMPDTIVEPDLTSVNIIVSSSPISILLRSSIVIFYIWDIKEVISSFNTILNPMLF